jgi:hypothetical protein
VTLPSRAAGPLTETVGYFDCEPRSFAAWLADDRDRPGEVRAAGWTSLADAARDLAPSPSLTRQGVVPIGSWSLLLTNGPRGTDVGMLPSLGSMESACGKPG